LPISDWPFGSETNWQSAIGNRQSQLATGPARSNLMKKTLTLGLILVGVLLAPLNTTAQTHRPVKHGGQICGNPKLKCKTSVTFQINDLPFQVGPSMVIVDTVPFYAVILKSMAVKNDNCDVFIGESERLAAQELFPDHKVFSSRCTDPENLFYADVTSRNPRFFSETHRLMAVYAGKTVAEAKTMLDAVKATGKYPGANIRRMRTGFNGT